MPRRGKDSVLAELGTFPAGVEPYGECMGLLDRFKEADNRREGLVRVRLSQHGCPQCGSMVALELARAHREWHAQFSDAE